MNTLSTFPPMFPETQETQVHPASNILLQFPAWNEYPESKRQELIELLVSTCFFLPRVILGNRDYQISKITKVSKLDFEEMLWKMPETTKLHCEVSIKLLQESEAVGISTRKNLATGITYIVAKIWYGANTRPERSNRSSSHYAS